MTLPTYAVIDVETTMDSPIGNKATAFHPANRIVLTGWRSGQWKAGETHTSNGLAEFSRCSDWTLLVGSNIGFDIHHLLRKGSLTKEFLGTVGLWDTQLAEYLLTAQRSVMVSLDELATKYGGTLKDDRVSKIFKSGRGADHVPAEMLREYLKDDLLNTELVFFKQFEQAQKLGMVPLIVSQMDALAATIEMTYNGLKVDVDMLLKGAGALRVEVDKIEATIKAIAEHWGWPAEAPFNVGSQQQLSKLLFGGEVKWKEKEVGGLTKAGKPVMRSVTKSKQMERRFTPIGDLNGHGVYGTDDAILQELRTRKSISLERDLLERVLEYREKNKQLTTYWEGLAKLVMPDGFIHHSLNHTVTRTGRLSSSEPNLQNVTNGDVKKVFVSRWGDDGVIVEADFKQLEMVELAEVSGDEQLIFDIENGIDMHDALFHQMHGRKMTKEERKPFKRCSFALVYGGGPNAVAAQGGCTIEEAKRFIDVFYNRYKGVKQYHDDIVQWAKDSREYHGLKDAETGLPMGEVTFINERTRRHYWFREYPTDWGSINFSPTELKNYMVQGGATGDKVPLCVGQLHRVLRNSAIKEKCLLINTVHDSVMFDCRKDVLNDALWLIKQTMERTPEFYEEAFGYKMKLPLKVELSYGPNWLDQTETEVTFDGPIMRKAA